MEDVYRTNRGQEGWYGSPQQLYRASKGAAKRKEVDEYLASQDAYTLNRRAVRRFPRRPIFSPGIDHIWQADLVQVPGTQRTRGWQGIKYFLTVIDVVSKFAWVQPLSRKFSSNFRDAFVLILKDGRKHAKLQTDRGKEFQGQPFQKMLHVQGIEWYASDSPYKAAIVERFNRTFMTRLSRFNSHVAPGKRGSIKRVVRDVTDSYNDSLHRSIGRKPNSVTQKNVKSVLRKLYPKRQVELHPKFAIGDKVRVNNPKILFAKGFRQTFSKTVYAIDRIKPTKPTTYVLRHPNGTILKGGYYTQELQLVL